MTVEVKYLTEFANANNVTNWSFEINNLENSVLDNGSGYILTFTGSTIVKSYEITSDTLVDTYSHGKLKVNSKLSDSSTTDVNLSMDLTEFANGNITFNFKKNEIVLPESYRVYVADNSDTTASFEYLQEVFGLQETSTRNVGEQDKHPIQATMNLAADNTGEKYFTIGGGTGQSYVASVIDNSYINNADYFPNGVESFTFHNMSFFTEFKPFEFDHDFTSNLNVIFMQFKSDYFKYLYHLDFTQNATDNTTNGIAKIAIKGSTVGDQSSTDPNTRSTNTDFFSNEISIDLTVYNKLCIVVNKAQDQERIAFFMNGVKEFDSTDFSGGNHHENMVNTVGGDTVNKVIDCLSAYRTASGFYATQIFRDTYATSDSKMKVKDFRIFPTVLSDIECINLTTRETTYTGQSYHVYVADNNHTNASYEFIDVENLTADSHPWSEYNGSLQTDSSGNYIGIGPGFPVNHWRFSRSLHSTDNPFYNHTCYMHFAFQDIHTYDKNTLYKRYKADAHNFLFYIYVSSTNSIQLKGVEGTVGGQNDAISKATEWSDEIFLEPGRTLKDYNKLCIVVNRDAKTIAIFLNGSKKFYSIPGGIGHESRDDDSSLETNLHRCLAEQTSSPLYLETFMDNNNTSIKKVKELRIIPEALIDIQCEDLTRI
tara:strand:+ start:213 stop:2174 length:1962 start_codon:yes stop_codon:yes gene_type:complete